MYIEDIIDKLVGIGSWTLIMGPADFLQNRDLAMLSSFDSQITRGLGLTKKQADAAERILKQHIVELSKRFQRDMTLVLGNPQYKLGIREISQDKAIKLAEDDNNQKIIRLIFPYDEKLIDSIKEFKKNSARTPYGYNSHSSVSWNPNTRTWDFEFIEENVDWVYQNFRDIGFSIDSEIVDVFIQIEKIKNEIENHVPMVIFEDGVFKFINTHKNIPQPTSTNLLEVLFQAKKYGIDTWDDAIDRAISDLSINDFTRYILTNSKSKEISVDNKIYDFSDFEDFISYQDKIIFIIPGGSELETLTHSVENLKKFGIKSNQMSVLFRLDSSAGAICNEYVKTNNLNNPISDEIKIFFISAKLPKPLIGAKLDIDAIFNLGNNSAHYTQKSLIRNHHLVINYVIKKQPREEYI